MSEIGGGLSSTEGSRGCVALVDWLWAGHHPAWFGLYASALLDLGYDVVPICPHPEAVPELTAAGKSGATAKLHQGYRLEFFAHANSAIPAAIRPVWATIRHYRRIAAMVADWESKHGRHVDLLFFACIYDDQFRYFRWVEPLLRRSWSGLYIHARSIRSPGTPLPGGKAYPCPERIFTLRRLKSFAVLDEGVVDTMSLLAGGKRVVVFPDLTDSRCAVDATAGLAGKLLTFAAGRPVVGCIGNLQRYKGVLELMRAASDDRLSGLCFAFIGEVNWAGFSIAERQQIINFWEKDQRVFCHALRVPDGERINGVLAACDVIYAAYLDFPHSSNILTKAAYLGRPVIVSDGYLMAERVREYRLGEVVPEGDKAEIARAINVLVTAGGNWSTVAQPRWRDYQERHSYEALVGAFKAMI